MIYLNNFVLKQTSLSISISDQPQVGEFSSEGTMHRRRWQDVVMDRRMASNFASANVIDARSARNEKINQAMTVWEDELDALGSDISLKDLSRLLDKAPTQDHELYRYAHCVYIERLGEAMMQWEDAVDAIGPSMSTEMLEQMISDAPNQKHELVSYLEGVLSQRYYCKC